MSPPQPVSPNQETGLFTHTHTHTLKAPGMGTELDLCRPGLTTIFTKPFQLLGAILTYVGALHAENLGQTPGQASCFSASA